MRKYNTTQKLVRKQLDKLFHKERKRYYKVPRNGWIQTICQSLGISQAILARKLSISRQGMRNIEDAERKGTITLSTFKKVADILNCELRVSLVPRESLEKMIRDRAIKKAKEIVQRTNLHMSLEAQGTDSKFQENQVKEIANDLIRNQDRRLWEDF